MDAHKSPAMTRTGRSKYEESVLPREQPPVSPGPPERKPSPERQFFYRLRGHPVQVCLLVGDTWEGVISWVDRYTFGVVVRDVGEILFFKHAVKTIQPLTSSSKKR